MPFLDLASCDGYAADDKAALIAMGDSLPARCLVAPANGTKHDTNKPRLELLPPSYWVQHQTSSYVVASWYFGGCFELPALEADPMPAIEYGASKYHDNNYIKGMRFGRLVGAFHRHFNVQNAAGIWVPRENLAEPDAESGLPHSSHAAACLVMLRELETRFAGTEWDDRFCPMVRPTPEAPIVMAAVAEAQALLQRIKP